MELVRIPIQELDKVWPIVDKDIRERFSLFKSTQTIQILSMKRQNKVNFKYGFFGIKLKNKLTKNILVL